MELKIIDKVLIHWKNERILSNGAKNIINNSFQGNGVMLPADFIEMYKISDGTSNSDKEGFLFYKSQNLVTMGDKFSLDIKHPLRNVIIFADYLQESWWYGIENDKDGYNIGIIPSANKFKLITRSLSEFLDLYIRDASDLYQYE